MGTSGLARPIGIFGRARNTFWVLFNCFFVGGGLAGRHLVCVVCIIAVRIRM